MSRVFIVFYFLVLLATLMVTTKTVQGPWLFLLRAFFPNWKFYHSLGWQPQLYVRSRNLGLARISDDQRGLELTSEPPSIWTENHLIYPRAKRNLLNLFHNPLINIALAHQNLVEHLANDLQALEEHQDPKQLVSYQLVNRFVRSHLCGLIRDSVSQGERLVVGGRPDGLGSELDRDTNSVEYQFEIRLKLNSPQIKARIQKERDLKDELKDDHKDEVHVLMISPILQLDLAQSPHPQKDQNPGSPS